MEFKTFLEEVLRTKKGLEGLEVREVREASCTKPGDNFMSVVKSVEVVGKLPGGQPHSMSLFLKRPLEVSARGLVSHVDEAFANEVLMYRRVLPLLGKSVGCPDCYHAAGDVIILQDLVKEGYRTVDRRLGLDLPGAAQVLKALARFHAASYYTSLTRKEEFFQTVSQLKPIGFTEPSNRDLVERALRRAVSLLREVEDVEGVVPALEQLQGKVSKHMRMLRQPGKVAVLVHGDFWINNILLRDSAEEPVRIVDFQACGVLCPSLDLWTLLSTSVQSDILETHLEQLLHTYCTSFTDLLSSLKTPTGQIPRTDDLLGLLKSKQEYGFLVATVYLPALDLSWENVTDLDKEKTRDDELFERLVSPRFKERLCSLARMYKKSGAFDKLINRT